MLMKWFATFVKTLQDLLKFKKTVKKFLPLVFALSIINGPVFAWGWGGDADCPYSKDKANHERTEQLEESDK